MFKLVTYPSDILKMSSSRVENFDKSLRDLIDGMVEMMYEKHGVGLAAPQLGFHKRIVVMDASAGDDKNDLTIMINPIIKWKSKEIEILEEGCLSLPGVIIRVPRHNSVEIEYQDVFGETHYALYNGWSARVIQHEIDHLEGTLMLDKAGPLERRMALKNVDKMAVSVTEDV